MKKPRKTKSRRDKAENPALDRKFMPRVRQELIDYDYLDQLSPEEKSWLNKFTDEYVNASFKKDGTDIQPYEKYGKDSNDRNNSRNRCLYTALKNKANKHNNKKLLNYDSVLSDVEDELSRDVDPMHMENAYVDFLEIKEVEAMIEEYDQAMINFREDDEQLPIPLELSLQIPAEPLKS